MIASCLYCSFWGDRTRGYCCYGSLPCNSFTTTPPQSSISLLPCSLQLAGAWVWAFIWFLGTAQITNMAPSCSRTMDPDKTLRGSLDHRHHHGLRWQRRLLRSVWSPDAAWPKAINIASGCSPDHRVCMAFGNSVDHRHQRRPWLL